MSMIKKIKTRIYLWLSKKNKDSKILKLLIKANKIFFTWNDRMHMTHPGKDDPEKIYYVIRATDKVEGLLSLYFNKGIKKIIWAKEHDYIPYIDFDSDKCQYHVKRDINGTNNAWNYYFKQPFSITAEELKNKKNVLLNGWELKNKEKYQELNIETVRSNIIKEICHNDCAVQPYILDMVENIAKEKIILNKTLGVFLRGTDYVALKPKGHYRQPSIEQVIDKIDEFCNKYDIQKIFVVTEDYTIYQKLKTKYGDIIFSSDDNFIKNYKTNDYLEGAFHDDPYERGLKYLIRLLLLTKCDYLISGITNGSLFALAEKQDSYRDEYLFDLGKYE